MDENCHMAAEKKRGNKPSAAKKILMKACETRGICKGGSIKSLLNRIEKHELRQVGRLQKGVSKSLKKATKSPNSSPRKPLRISAKEYIERFCNGDLNNAREEWVDKKPSNKSDENKNSKWMKADIRGSKAGPIIRWVIA